MPQLLGFALSALVPSQGRAEAAGGVLAVTSVQVEAPEGCRDNVKHYLSSTDDPKSLLEAGGLAQGAQERHGFTTFQFGLPQAGYLQQAESRAHFRMSRNLHSS